MDSNSNNNNSSNSNNNNSNNNGKEGNTKNYVLRRESPRTFQTRHSVPNTCDKQKSRSEMIEESLIENIQQHIKDAQKHKLLYNIQNTQQTIKNISDSKANTIDQMKKNRKSFQRDMIYNEIMNTTKRREIENTDMRNDSSKIFVEQNRLSNKHMTHKQNVSEFPSHTEYIDLENNTIYSKRNEQRKYNSVVEPKNIENKNNDVEYLHTISGNHLKENGGTVNVPHSIDTRNNHSSPIYITHTSNAVCNKNHSEQIREENKKKRTVGGRIEGEECIRIKSEETERNKSESKNKIEEGTLDQMMHTVAELILRNIFFNLKNNRGKQLQALMYKCKTLLMIKDVDIHAYLDSLQSVLVFCLQHKDAFYENSLDFPFLINCLKQFRTLYYKNKNSCLQSSNNVSLNKSNQQSQETERILSNKPSKEISSREKELEETGIQHSTNHKEKNEKPVSMKNTLEEEEKKLSCYYTDMLHSYRIYTLHGQEDTTYFHKCDYCNQNIFNFKNIINEKEAEECMYECNISCRRKFHKTCVTYFNIDDDYICFFCMNEIELCGVCKEMAISENVHMCYYPFCNMVLHEDCMSKLAIHGTNFIKQFATTEYELVSTKKKENIISLQGQGDSEVPKLQKFICPLHICCVCKIFDISCIAYENDYQGESEQEHLNKKENEKCSSYAKQGNNNNNTSSTKKDTNFNNKLKQYETNLFRCVTCFKAFHYECMGNNYVLSFKQKLMICAKHTEYDKRKHKECILQTIINRHEEKKMNDEPTSISNRIHGKPEELVSTNTIEKARSSTYRLLRELQEHEKTKENSKNFVAMTDSKRMKLFHPKNDMNKKSKKSLYNAIVRKFIMDEEKNKATKNVVKEEIWNYPQGSKEWKQLASQKVKKIRFVQKALLSLERVKVSRLSSEYERKILNHFVFYEKFYIYLKWVFNHLKGEDLRKVLLYYRMCLRYIENEENNLSRVTKQSMIYEMIMNMPHVEKKNYEDNLNTCTFKFLTDRKLPLNCDPLLIELWVLFNDNELMFTKENEQELDRNKTSVGLGVEKNTSSENEVTQANDRRTASQVRTNEIQDKLKEEIKTTENNSREKEKEKDKEKENNMNSKESRLISRSTVEVIDMIESINTEDISKINTKREHKEKGGKVDNKIQEDKKKKQGENNDSNNSKKRESLSTQKEDMKNTAKKENGKDNKKNKRIRFINVDNDDKNDKEDKKDTKDKKKSDNNNESIVSSKNTMSKRNKKNNINNKNNEIKEENDKDKEDKDKDHKGCENKIEKNLSNNGFEMVDYNESPEEKAKRLYGHLGDSFLNEFNIATLNGTFFSLANLKKYCAFLNFTYVSRNVYTGPHSKNLLACKGNDLSKCNCEGVCDPDTCYNALSKIQCSRGKCNLPVELQNKNCLNRPFKKSAVDCLEIRQTERMGFGVFCKRPIKNGELICEYVGEVLGRDEFEKRLEVYKEEQKRVEFYNWYSIQISRDVHVDSGRKGNISRFMNHSCSPNSVSQKWIVQGNYRIGIFALQDIPEGSEIMYNYSYDFVFNNFECLCKSPKCMNYTIDQSKKKKLKKEDQEDKPVLKKNADSKELCIFSDDDTTKGTVFDPVENFNLLHRRFQEWAIYVEDNSKKALYKSIRADNGNDNKDDNKKTVDAEELELIRRTCIINLQNLRLMETYASWMMYDLSLNKRLYYSIKSRPLNVMTDFWKILVTSFSDGERYLANAYNLFLPSLVRTGQLRRIQLYSYILHSVVGSEHDIWRFIDKGFGDDEVCRKCKNCGNLTMCDGCFNSFHQRCANMRTRVLKGSEVVLCKFCQRFDCKMRWLKMNREEKMKICVIARSKIFQKANREIILKMRKARELTVNPTIESIIAHNNATFKKMRLKYKKFQYKYVKN